MTTATEIKNAELAVAHLPTGKIIIAVGAAVDDVRLVGRQIHQLVDDLRRDLHTAFGTAGPRIDQKLPLEVRRSLEQIDHAAAELRVIVRDLLLDVKATVDDDEDDA